MQTLRSNQFSWYIYLGSTGSVCMALLVEVLVSTETLTGVLLLWQIRLDKYWWITKVCPLSKLREIAEHNYALQVNWEK